jgi:hypothetical protein
MSEPTPPPPPSSNIALTAEDLEICKARAARPNAGAITHADPELSLTDVRDVLVNEMSSLPVNPGQSFVYELTLTFDFRRTRDGKDEHWSYQQIEIMRESGTAVDQPFSVGRHEQLPYFSRTTGGGCGQGGDYESCGAFSFSTDSLPKLNLNVTSRTDEEIDGELEIPDGATGKVLHAGFQALLHAPKEPGDGKSICCVNP